MRIAFEINDTGFVNKDLANPENGNPGVGGTWYEFALVVSALISYGKREDQLFIYHYRDNLYPVGANTYIVKDEEDLFSRATQDDIDILVYKTDKKNDWYDCLNHINVKCIAWAHTFLSYRERMLIERCDQVKRVICVGKEHYDLYIDEDIIKKTDYIYNMVAKTDNFVRQDYDKEVTYIGSITPTKSFHVLASVWKDILKKIPDAKLNVIGSGSLYNQNTKLGEYGIAEEKYEKLFIRYLTDEDGKILDSVRFYGNLGVEKRDVILKSAVGVVNPTTKSETFCISAVEFEQYGVPVCAGRKNGLLDTVAHGKSGLLSRNKRQLKRHIIKLLQEDEYNKFIGSNAKQYVEQFLPLNLVHKWEECFSEIELNKQAVYRKTEGNYFYNTKFLRCFLRFLRIDVRLTFLPSMGKLEDLCHMAFKGLKRTTK